MAEIRKRKTEADVDTASSDTDVRDEVISVDKTVPVHIGVDKTVPVQADIDHYTLMIETESLLQICLEWIFCSKFSAGHFTGTKATRKWMQNKLIICQTPVQVIIPCSTIEEVNQLREKLLTWFFDNSNSNYDLCLSSNENVFSAKPLPICGFTLVKALLYCKVEFLIIRLFGQKTRIFNFCEHFLLRSYCSFL